MLSRSLSSPMPNELSNADTGVGGIPSRRARLARNSVWNMIGWAGVLVMTIASLPWYLRLLGETQYGLMVLVMGIVAPLGVLDLGMSDATVKYLAESIGRGDLEGTKRYAHSSLAFGVVAGVLGAMVIISIADHIVTKLFNIPVEHQALARLSIRWVSVLWFFMQLRQPLMGVVSAMQRYDVLSTVTMITQGCVIGAGLWSLITGGNLAEMIQAQALTAAAFSGIWGFVAWRLCPPIRFPVRVDLHSLRRMFSFGLWQMVNSLGSILSAQSQSWLLGILLPVKTVGYYNIAAKVVSIGYMASYKVGQVLFPEVSRMQGQGDEGGAARLAVNASWLLTTLSAMLFVPLVVFAHDLLRLYLNLSMADNSTEVLRILAIGTGLGCSFAIPSFYLLGTGRSKWLAAMSLLFGIVTFVGCFFLIPILGISGAGWGMSVATLVHVATLILLWWRVLNRWISGKVYLASTFAPFLVASIVALGGIVVRDFVSWEMGWIDLGTMGSLLATFSAAAILTIDGMLPGGKQRRELLRSLISRAVSFVVQMMHKH